MEIKDIENENLKKHLFHVDECIQQTVSTIDAKILPRISQFFYDEYAEKFHNYYWIYKLNTFDGDYTYERVDNHDVENVLMFENKVYVYKGQEPIVKTINVKIFDWNSEIIYRDDWFSRLTHKNYPEIVMALEKINKYLTLQNEFLNHHQYVITKKINHD